MSGIVSGINYNLLFSGESSTDATASILAALYSNTSATTPTTTFVASGNPVTDLTLAQKEETTGVAQEAKQPLVAEAINAFTTAVNNATSIQSALANPDVQKVLLAVTGLTSYSGDTALVQKIFLSDPSDPNSLVNQLNNSTAVSAVQTYDFAKTGLAGLQNPNMISTISNAYAQVQWLDGLDQATPGLSNALTFLNQASSITNAYDVLGNYTNFQVITGALDIPQSIVFQDQPAQASAINSKLDYSQLQNRSYVTSLTDQYLLTMQEQKNSSSSSGSGLTGLSEAASSGLVV
jgi:hypothetical protein